MTAGLAENPLRGFDFACLDDATFGEDAVREELIAPILRALGFGPTGRFKVQRSRSLRTPFVMLGSRRRPIRIVPDYTLSIDDQAVAVLDAKAPWEDAARTEHVWQAYSYAVHPEIRCRRYGVCNGRKLVLYTMDSWRAEIDVDLTRLEECWEVLVGALGPEALRPRQEDAHMAWFSLLGAVLSPNTDATAAADAAYRLSWYMPTVDASREAAVKAAMANLSDTELVTVLRAANRGYEMSDGVMAEHVGDLLSYDTNIVSRLKDLLARHAIPKDLEFVATEMVLFIGQEE